MITTLLLQIYYTAQTLIGSVCHRLPERTILLGTVAMPVCARCAGFYLSVFVTILILAVLKRLGGSKPPPLSSLLLLTTGFLLLAIDGVTSYSGLRETTNTIRIITGLFAGPLMPVIIVLLNNYRVDGQNSQILLKGPGDVIGFWGCNALVLLMIQFQWLNPYLLGSIILLSICGLFYAIPHMVLLGLHPVINRKTVAIAAFLVMIAFFAVLNTARIFMT